MQRLVSVSVSVLREIKIVGFDNRSVIRKNRSIKIDFGFGQLEIHVGLGLKWPKANKTMKNLC